MENVLFYLLIILCLGLIITTAVYMNRFNNMKMLFEAADKTNDNLLQERMKISKKCTEFEELAKRINKQLEEAYTTNSDQAKLIQKLTDELTIKNTTIESLTNHLKDKVKPFDPLDALDDLIPRRIETKKGQIKQIVPNALMDQTQLISTILHSINTYNNLYPKESTKFNRELIEAINGTIMERSKKTK